MLSSDFLRGLRIRLVRAMVFPREARQALQALRELHSELLMHNLSRRHHRTMRSLPDSFAAIAPSPSRIVATRISSACASAAPSRGSRSLDVSPDHDQLEKVAGAGLDPSETCCRFEAGAARALLGLPVAHGVPAVEVGVESDTMEATLTAALM